LCYWIIRPSDHDASKPTAPQQFLQSNIRRFCRVTQKAQPAKEKTAKCYPDDSWSDRILQGTSAMRCRRVRPSGSVRPNPRTSSQHSTGKFEVGAPDTCYERPIAVELAVKPVGKARPEIGTTGLKRGRANKALPKRGPRYRYPDGGCPLFRPLSGGQADISPTIHFSSE
jgi:hypothetical protein